MGASPGTTAAGSPPARVRRPRDKGLAEGTANMVGRWATAPSREPCLRDLGESNDCLGDGVDWPSAREVPDCGASRDERPPEGLPRLPPPARHETCDRCRPKVAPDHHVRVGHMRHPVPLALVGRTVGVGVTDRAVRVMGGGEAVAERPRPRGGRGQCPTDEPHMPPERRDARGPRSRESLESRADGVGPATGERVRGALASRSVVERALVACRNVPGLPRSRSPGLPERACARFVAFRARAMGQGPRETRGDESHGSRTLEEKARETVDAEEAARQARKVARLVGEARLKEPAARVGDITHMPERKLGKGRVARLAERSRVGDDEVPAAISKTGCGESLVAQAIGSAARGRPLPTRHVRPADLCAGPNRARLAKGGAHLRLTDRLKSIKPPIIDDFLTTPIGTASSVDPFEIPEAREGGRATMIASRLGPNEWHLRTGGEPIADSTLGRVASACRYLDIDGPNMSVLVQ